MDGLTRYGILSTGKELKVYSCPSDLSSKLRHQRAFMAGSTLAARSPRYLPMLSMLTSALSVYS
jgi:hypothetical protein